ncbi:LAFE_0E04852g1_1 [Lachancea fermentati]|uniref:UDP-N-acetylglucosamine transferase subunit ALG14 n=1 Tax=Lachancea fermentati TaxID=4955 RepID=A0A1G4MCX7_LACFM|nr:LAFE_0E04852g1_1 [Lachancea fermentati]
MIYMTCMGALVVLQWLMVKAVLTLPIFGYKCDTKTKLKDESVLARQQKETLRLFVFLGSGGHTGEMLRLLQNYEKTLLAAKNEIYVGYSDDASLAAFQRLEKKFSDVKVSYIRFGKAREVGSSKLQSLVSIARTLLQSIQSLTWLKYQFLGQSHLVLLNGPGTCCVISYWLKLLEILTCTRSKILYVESLARTDSLSLTGKLLYPIVDEFVVQWEELHTHYERSKCFGILV